MPKIRVKRSAIWQHFVIEYQENRSKAIVKCNRCSLIVPCCKNTTNLWSHVRTHHRNVLEESSSGVSNEEASETRALAPNSPEFEREAVTSSGQRSPSDPTAAHEITRSLVKMIAEDVLPFSIVNSKGFASFVGKLNERYKIPKRNTLIARFLPELYAGKCKELDESLSRAGRVNVAISSQPSTVHGGLILATSVHFSADGAQHHKLLRISFRPTDHSVPLSSELGEIAETWRFCLKVNVVTVDNASSDAAHGSRNACFAHALSHIARTAVSQTKLVLDLVEKCREIVRDSKIQNAVAKSQRSPANSSRRLSLLKDTDDRWVSTYSMLNRMHELKPILLQVLADTSPSLSENEWNVISEAIARGHEGTAPRSLRDNFENNTCCSRHGGCFKKHRPLVDRCDVVPRQSAGTFPRTIRRHRRDRPLCHRHVSGSQVQGRCVSFGEACPRSEGSVDKEVERSR
ncbi:Zinc finger BED domain-containing protein 4 [Melipona quadrifasciata]|uniref:Zinc finger BED domain-containing protein 4 n=1 Tax=Melipona quadrifasciata TaxID=166423 RepID=A0A0M9A8L8_9HYME|nr:Zinc finger BED domain-containing protein 4 [Melipona quadrifasciata]